MSSKQVVITTLFPDSFFWRYGYERIWESSGKAQKADTAFRCDTACSVGDRYGAHQNKL